jgi:uncharacterized OB-fold protein
MKAKVRRYQQEYKVNRYIQKNKKYQQAVDKKYTYKEDKIIPGKCQYCGKVYTNR